MERQAFLTLTSSSQWLLFLAIGLVIFSWIEKKKLLQQLGQAAFFLLGAFAIWVITSHQIVVPEVVKGAQPPAEALAVTYFSALIWLGAFGLLAFGLGFLRPIWSKYMTMVLIPVAMALFFMVYHLQQI